MFMLNGDTNSPSADVSLLSITLVRTEHMVEQCFSNLGSAGKGWPLHAVDCLRLGKGERRKGEKIDVNDLTIYNSASSQKCRFLHLALFCLGYSREKSAVIGVKKK